MAILRAAVALIAIATRARRAATAVGAPSWGVGSRRRTSRVAEAFAHEIASAAAAVQQRAFTALGNEVCAIPTLASGKRRSCRHGGGLSSSRRRTYTVGSATFVVELTPRAAGRVSACANSV